MNRRQWKKAAKKAAVEVSRRWPGQYTFEPAKGDETVDAPHGYEPLRQEGKSGRRYTEVPRGTPICWRKTSYEYDEWECEDALRIRDQMDLIESVDWAAEMAKSMARDAAEEAA